MHKRPESNFRNFNVRKYPASHSGASTFFIPVFHLSVKRCRILIRAPPFYSGPTLYFPPFLLGEPPTSYYSYYFKSWNDRGELLVFTQNILSRRGVCPINALQQCWTILCAVAFTIASAEFTVFSNDGRGKNYKWAWLSLYATQMLRTSIKQG